jgi:hypothetical protein
MAGVDRPSADDFSVVAIIAAHNEADVIASVVGDLIAQGVSVYLLDHGSTDGTVAAVEPYRDHGLLAIERVDDEGEFALERIVGRKQALATQLPATWLINHDADEFRESPWRHLALADAIRLVDRLGYNAIDFALFNFWPTHDGFRPGDDPRAAFPAYEPGPPWDRLQVRCWKKTTSPVDLVSSAGHEAAFDGRRVFPLRFVLRHYPIRGQAHGERKVLRERHTRFAAGERRRGWHVQYDDVGAGHRFLRDPATLVPWDPDAIRAALQLDHRGVEALRADVASLGAELERARDRLDDLARVVAVREGEIGDLRRELGVQLARLAEIVRGRGERDAEILRLAGDVERLGTALGAVLASRSWRWTAPLRAAARLLRG